MKEVLNNLKNILKENDTVVIGLSGGPDSMFLLSLLLKIPSIKIVAAHINHNIRKESASEEEFVKKYCTSNGVAFETKKIVTKIEKNFEQKARDFRYNFFEEMVTKYKATYLMTAHHGDDLMETILMRITRGSTLKGYAGFKMIYKNNNYYVVKPLISMTKDQIMGECKKNDIPYVIDKSNYENIHTRNRYRNTILPFLKKEDKNVNQKFLKYSEELFLYDNYIDTIVSKNMKKVFNNNILDLVKFNKNDEFIKNKTIFKIVNNIYDKNMSKVIEEHCRMIINLINNHKSNCKIYLPNNIIVSKNYDKLIFDYHNNKIQPYYHIFNEKEFKIDNRKISLINESDEKSNYVTRLFSSEIRLPLIIRSKRNGDKIEIKNLNGAKKIKDIFIDCKINLEERQMYPIVTDSNDEILWIPGIKKSKFDKDKNEKYDIILKYN